MGLEPSIDDDSKPDPELATMMTGRTACPRDRSAIGRCSIAVTAQASARRFPQRAGSRNSSEETVAFWCEQFVDAGIPAEKLYPHVAAPGEGIEIMNAPIWTAFNKYSRPGWTTYPVGVLGESFKPLYDELKKHGNPPWAGVEANAGMPGSVVVWETYLAWHYNHGCVLVGVNMGATGQDLPKRLWERHFQSRSHRGLSQVPDRATACGEGRLCGASRVPHPIQDETGAGRDSALVQERQGSRGGGQAHGTHRAAGGYWQARRVGKTR